MNLYRLKKTVALTVLICCVLSLSSCIFSKDRYSVTLVTDGQSETVTVKSGGVIPSKYEPSKEGYIFTHWYIDEQCNFRFTGTVNSDLTLYAGFTVDFVEFANRVNEELVPTTVKVSSRFYKTNALFKPTEQQSSGGSGIVFHHTGTYTYILTNYHVINKPKYYSKAQYTVYNAYGESQTAELIAEDSEYDLAVLRIYKDSDFLKAELGDSLDKGDFVVAIGAPDGQYNSVSYGEYIEKKEVERDEGDSAYQTDINFAVGWHTAQIDHGSSGGGLFDENMKLVGVNFATGYDKNGEFLVGLCIPIEKVKEFLDKYELEY